VRALSGPIEGGVVLPSQRLQQEVSSADQAPEIEAGEPGRDAQDS